MILNWNARFQTISRYLSLAVTGIGVMVLVGWILDIHLLKTILPDLVPMKPNTALGLTLAGTAFYLLHPQNPTPLARRTGQAAALIVLLIGLLTLGEYAFKTDFEIDQLLFQEPDIAAENLPGRPSQITAFCLLLAGLSIFLFTQPRLDSLRRLLAGVAGAIGLFAVVAFLYGATSLYQIADFRPVPVISALGFFLLGLACLLSRPTQGFFGLLADNGPAGILARRLFPACILIPTVIGWIILRGQNAGFVDVPVSLALFSVLTTVAFVLLVGSSARQVYRYNLEHQRAQARFKTLFDKSLDVIVVTDAIQGQIIDVNEGVERTLGYAPAALRGSLFSSLFPPQTEDEQKAFAETLQAHGYVFLSQEFLRADGTTCPMDLTAAIIPWEEERAILITLRDVSERKHLVDEIYRAERLHEEIEKERELMQLKEDFITMVSHDFRTPLAVIMTSGDMLERYYERLSAQRRGEQLQKIRQQVWYMTGLLDDVLLLGKARAKRLEFNPAPVDLKKVCWSVFDETRMTTDSEKYTFQFHASGQFGEMHLDEKLLHRILANLISNAVKYSPDGGVIRLELACENEEAVLTVSDEGIGIPEKDQARLFEPFHRGSNTSGISGTGLGLAIVYESVQIHGGTIRLESSGDGTGTRFTVRLPAH